MPANRRASSSASRNSPSFRLSIQRPQSARSWQLLSPSRSASASAAAQAAPASRARPTANISAQPSAAESLMRARAASSVSPTMLASARSTRARHSPISDSWTQSGTAAAVSATPTAGSPAPENAQSSAARTLSIWRP